VPADGPDALAVFLGPHAYVSPSWYPSKREHGKVVPTWNYLTVHAYGPLRRVDDPAWLRAFVTRLTDTQERHLPEPWALTDAPEPFVDQMVKGIVGVEIPVRRLEGKWKLSQNRPEGDCEGTVRGLRDQQEPGAAAIADAMAGLRPRAGD
jgi:transcriptional regulator